MSGLGVFLLIVLVMAIILGNIMLLKKSTRFDVKHIQKNDDKGEDKGKDENEDTK
jgi:hypothetical protein